jgi:hypothetical protein
MYLEMASFLLLMPLIYTMEGQKLLV